MPKRKAQSDKGSHADDSEDGTDIVDVDFEWFDPASVDFHGLKQLLKQLFDADHELLDLSGLSDQIIAQPHLGSVVKVGNDENEAKDNDPFGFLGALSVCEHFRNTAVQTMVSYLHKHASVTPSLSKILPQLLVSSQPTSKILDAEAQDTQPHAALILTERFVNIPPAIMPPTYGFLLDELRDAAADGSPYPFTHFLLLSKVYREDLDAPSTSDSSENDGVEPTSPTRRKKKKSKGGDAAKKKKGEETFYFHPEDEIFRRHAVAHGEFRYQREDAQDSDIKPRGLLMVIEKERLEAAVRDAGEFITGSTRTS